MKYRHGVSTAALMAQAVRLAIEAGADPERAWLAMAEVVAVHDLECRIAYEEGVNDGLTLRQSVATDGVCN